MHGILDGDPAQSAGRAHVNGATLRASPPFGLRSLSHIHEPLVDGRLFRDVQNVLDGKLKKRPTKHEYLYRKLFSCGGCGRTLEREGVAVAQAAYVAGYASAVRGPCLNGDDPRRLLRQDTKQPDCGR